MDILKHPTFEEQTLSQKAGRFVLSVFDENQDNRLVFHNYNLASSCADHLKAIELEGGHQKETLEIAGLVSWFLSLGYLFDYQSPLTYALRELGRFFSVEECSKDFRSRSIQALQTTLHQQKPVTPEEKLIADVYQISAYLQDFEQRMDLLKLERTLLLDTPPNPKEWVSFQQQLLMQLRLHTAYGRKQFGPVLGAQLLRLQKESKKQEAALEHDSENPLRFNLEKKAPSRGTQTFFRTNFRNHINLSAIADKKAHILISVNAIMISVLITLLSYRNIAETKPIILIPVIIFLTTGLVSLIFAVLSARPKVTRHLEDKSIDTLLKKNVIFFGTFAQLDLEDYEIAMDRLLKDDTLLYGNMVRDMYFLGKVLDKKYRNLSVSYNVFMLGFVVTVLSFLVVLFV